MIVSAKIRLADARAELALSQAALAFFSGISKPTVVKAENGLPIQRIGAHRILHFLNAERQKVGKPALTIDDIEWKIL